MLRYLTLIAALLVPLNSFAASSDFLIHEWGTFTSLQDPDSNGRTIGGINSDDEPVPPFVHNLAWDLILGDAQAQARNRLYQGWPHAHRDVAMRLETPVLYVHAGDSADAKLDVSVEFRGGWLTQFYPDAEFVGPDRNNIKIDSNSRGRLTWKNVSLRHDNPPGPETKEHVWTTPRNVDATTLSTPKGETEKYLFYRGVGHLVAPLRVVRDGEALRVHASLDPRMHKATPLRFSRLWLCDIKPDGRCAFRPAGPIDSNMGKAETPSSFREEDYSTANLAALRTDMKAALVTAGLYEDEAKAMLDTWELSYFKSWGTRLFYIVPPAWTEYVLPLRVSPKPTEITRVMVGRIDLVTPRHRELLAKITSARDVKKQEKELWKAYDELGRFRNALVLDAQKRDSSTTLQQFISAHGLEGFGE
jgi:hypothetical protein